MVKQSDICLSDRATLAKTRCIHKRIQPAKLVDSCGYNPGGRVPLLEMSGYEGRLCPKFQYFGDDFLATLGVTISQNDRCRARAGGFKYNCSSYTLRGASDEQDFVINANFHFRFENYGFGSNTAFTISPECMASNASCHSASGEMRLNSGPKFN